MILNINNLPTTIQLALSEQAVEQLREVKAWYDLRLTLIRKRARTKKIPDTAYTGNALGREVNYEQ